MNGDFGLILKLDLFLKRCVNEFVVFVLFYW